MCQAERLDVPGAAIEISSKDQFDTWQAASMKNVPVPSAPLALQSFNSSTINGAGTISRGTSFLFPEDAVGMS